MKSGKTEPYSYPEYWQDSTENKVDSADNVVLDTIFSGTNKAAAKTSSRQSSSYSYDNDDEQNYDPEYREGGKYDPAKYHTDYSKDQEERRRRFIDNDGFDDDDGMMNIVAMSTKTSVPRNGTTDILYVQHIINRQRLPRKINRNVAQVCRNKI